MTNPSLPPEILDYIIDLLHDEPKTLRQCCLASKSWVPRTRKYLFVDIKFRSASDLESWKKAFPEVANSPAYHAHTLFVGCPWLATALEAEGAGWVRAFSSVVSMEVNTGDRYIRASGDSLAPLYGISPSLKSLRVGPVALPNPQVFDLICSFPLLEDLTLTGYDPLARGDYPGMPQANSPALTGSLGLHIEGGAESTARQLLELPNGLHFRKLALSWGWGKDLWWIKELVVMCSHTLESLDISHNLRGPCLHIRSSLRA